MQSQSTTGGERSDGTWIQRACSNLGLAVASVAVFFAVSEGTLRLWDRALHEAPLVSADPLTDLYAPHPYLPLVLKPSTEYRDNDTAGRINALGMRGPEREPIKRSGVFRVICVGGSTTFGAGIVGDERTYPARLEAALKEAWPGRSIEIWNAGVPGYTTAENVIYLSLRLIDYRPDLIVLYEGYNDFKPNRHPGFRSDYSHWRDRSVAPRRSPLEGLRLYARLSALIGGRLSSGEASVRDPRSGRPLERYDTAGEEGLDVFRRNLRTMIATSRAAGARVLLATYPHPCTVENLASRPGLFRYLPGYVPTLSFEGVRNAFDSYNQAVRSVAQEEGALLADAARAVPADPDLFVDHIHFSAAGADAFARQVAAAIVSGAPRS